MMLRPRTLTTLGLLTLLLFTIGLHGCSQSSSDSAASSQIVETMVALKPSTAPLQIALINGQLQDLNVVRRVEEGTGIRPRTARRLAA